MRERVVINLASWIIRDGNYGDFRTGERRAFALEFHAREPLAGVEAWQDATPRHAHKADAEYAVFGQSIFDDPEWSVLDFGLRAFTATRGRQRFATGAAFRGRINLGIDPFFYFERLAKAPSAPPLICDWKIERIQIQTAPFVEVSSRYFERDRTKLGWRDVIETNAWTDDGGHAEYLLHCERLGSDYRSTLQP